MEDIAFSALEGALKGMPPARRRDPEALAESLRRAVRSELAAAWGKKPICKVLIHVV